MERLETLKGVYRRLSDAGLVTSQRDFARLLGMNEKGISSAMNGSEKNLTASLIAKATRLADDLLKEQTPPTQTIPLVPFAVRGGGLQGFSDGATEEECERIISPVRGAEIGMEVVGDSMSPDYPAGTRVILKHVDPDTFIAWGEVYVIDSVNGPILKKIMPTDSPDEWECVSINPAYPPFRIKTAHIRGVWRVLLRLIQ